MPRSCSVCNHPLLRAITGDLMARRPYRSIQSRYGISKSALERHVSRHVTKALRKLTAVDMPIALAAEIGEPVLVEMRKLNGRSLRILKAAEEEKVCACGAIHTTDGWLTVGQFFVRERLAQMTPEQRSKISAEGWAGMPKGPGRSGVTLFIPPVNSDGESSLKYDPRTSPFSTGGPIAPGGAQERIAPSRSMLRRKRS